MDTRREFLKNLATAALALSLDPFKTIVIADDQYHNSRLGLRLRRPENWEFSSVADFAALRDRQILWDSLGVIDEAHPLKDPDNLPVFLLEQPQYRTGNFVPGIALYDEPVADVSEDQELGHLNMLLGFASCYRDVNIENYPESLDLNGEPATVSDWSYLHEIDSGESHLLKVKTVVALRKDRAHTYHLVDNQATPHIAASEWSEFLRSIVYERQNGAPQPNFR